MVHTTTHGVATPSVNVAINKSRLKTYTKDGENVHYLKKGAEFQIELFNPTSDVISARISINGKRISQRGLVLKPGVRIFLDRYIDVTQKFKFDTYEVSNSKEVQKAIEDNGSIEVDFYKESDPNRYKYFDTTPYYRSIFQPSSHDGTWAGDDLTINCGGNTTAPYSFPNTNTSNASNYYSQNSETLSFNPQNMKASAFDSNGSATMDSMDSMRSFAGGAGGASAGDIVTGSINASSGKLRSRKVKSKSKSIETGRVEAGSHSSQSFTDVALYFESHPFCTRKLKLLPESVKQITTSDLNKRRYCHNCGSKSKANFKFCPNCGSKV